MSKLKSAALNGHMAGLRLHVEYVPLERLKPGPNQTRRHTRRQIRQIGRSLVDHGFIIPIVSYGDNIIACGHARAEAARIIGMREVPVIRATHLTDAQMRLFAMADNKLTEGGSWDFDAVKIEFADIAIIDPDLDQSRSAFSFTERDIIFGITETERLSDFDDAPGLCKGAPTARVGERYRLADHSVTCGNATDPAVIAKAAGDQQIRTVAGDPPFNVSIPGHVSGLGEQQHANFQMASGEMSKPQFTDFLLRAIVATQNHLMDGALLYLFMDWRHLAELIEASERAKLDYLNLLVWAKTNAGMGSFYRSAHEMIGVFKHGAAPHRNNVELGRHGRYRTNVLHYPGANTFARRRKKALELHPTVKPVALIADLILDSSGPGDVILDPFGGSGTTLIAAEKTNRRACLVEIDPAYVDAAIRRFEAATGISAILEDTGQTFTELAAERLGREAS